ncbi:protein YgfX [Candidatus Thiosymbion oneisti]|uniref:protein YgfX n=1 Tax=Candidatus Thiosymbion oneisti TaxID=589554 RepID=UPI000B7FC57C|nr:protein YgfX [Candidatus Thiosymbion oneisti]
MGENRELPPLRIRPRPSRILAVFLLVTHGAALSVVVALPLDWYWRSGLAILVLTSLINTIGTQVLFLVPWAGREAIWEPDGTWTLTLVSGKQVEARLLPSTFVTPGLLVLNLRCGRWRSCAMVLLPDTLDPDLLRRLRVRLRLWGTLDKSGTDASA